MILYRIIKTGCVEGVVDLCVISTFIDAKAQQPKNIKKGLSTCGLQPEEELETKGDVFYRQYQRGRYLIDDRKCIVMWHPFCRVGESSKAWEHQHRN